MFLEKVDEVLTYESFDNIRHKSQIRDAPIVFDN